MNLDVLRDQESFGYDRRLTFTARISLHEFVLGASFRELRRKTCQLRQDLVNKANLGGKTILMKMEG